MYTNSQSIWNLIYCQNNILKHNLNIIYTPSLLLYSPFKIVIASSKIDPISILHNVKNMENWLETPRIISAPGLIQYKNIIFSLFMYMYVIKYKANKGVCCVVLSLLVNYTVRVKVHSTSTVNYKIICLFLLTVLILWINVIPQERL